ncbi:hypothetical protein K457DRAFT_33918 [Linnemannia elongata AG-77]|uniref:Uncharacterized protein n=1 Tax=Linnemannia elongata AG-77 TaxID=1314771 RepID=A0A197JPS5_9FUNG|nr:hypothetical protein K457DRAFT_33918 [Linnemannia elongata AG-77]
MEDHIFECDGIKYRFSLVVPLNQTHRTTEPDFTMKCNETHSWYNIFMLVFWSLAVIYWSMFVIIPSIFNYFSPYHYSRWKVVLVNVGAFVWNLATCWRSPKSYQSMPTRGSSQTSTTSGVTTITPVPLEPSTPVLPLTTLDGPDSTTSTNLSPRRGFFAWTKSLFSRNQPTTSETTTTHEQRSSTEPRESRMSESTLTDVEMARPVWNLTWRRGTEETLTPYRT